MTTNDQAGAAPPDSSPGAALAAGRSGPRWRIALRAAGLVVLAIGLLRSADLVSTTTSALAATQWTGFAAALCAYGVGLWVSAARLRVLAGAVGPTGGTAALYGDIFKSTALNALITVGSGEVYRTLALKRRGLAAGDAAAVVILDRLIGLLVIGAAGVGGLFVFGGELTGWPIPATVAVGLAVVALAFAAWAGPRLLARVAPGALPIFSRPRLLGAAVGCSVVVLFTSVSTVWLLARALGLSVAPEVVLFAAPLVAIAAMLPISIGGIGVREAGYALLLGPYGVGVGEAVALGLLQYGTYLIAAAIGGLLLVADRGPGRADGATAQVGVDP